MSLRRLSSQHSSSCNTLSFPVICVASTYSCQRVKKYVHSSLDPAAEIVGRLTLSILAALVCCELVGAATCVPFECTEISTAASASSTSSVSYVHSGNGHLYFGMFGQLVGPCNAVSWRYLGVCSRYGGVARAVIIQDGGRSVNSVSFKRKVTAFFSLLRSGRSPKCCVGLFASYVSLVINRNESISDV